MNTIEWVEHRPHLVQIQPPIYPEDEFSDLLKEALLAGRDIDPLVREWINDKEHELRAEGARVVLGLVIGSMNPALACAQLAFACGMSLQMNLSGPKIAKKFGISKQAFQQGVEKVRKTLGVERTKHARSAEARHEMRLCNYRKPKKKFL